MIKVLNIVFLTIILNSCEINKNDMTIVDITMDISYTDSNSTDLLDPLNDEAFDKDLIKIYHLNNGIKELFYQSHLTSPKGYLIFKEENFMDKHYMKLSQPKDYNNDSNEILFEATTLIELNETVIDTITCLFEKGENSLVCKQVQYNGNIVWDWDDNTVRKFTIIK